MAVLTFEFRNFRQALCESVVETGIEAVLEEAIATELLSQMAADVAISTAADVVGTVCLNHLLPK